MEEESDDEEEVIAEPLVEDKECEGEVTLNAINVQTPPNTLKLST